MGFVFTTAEINFYKGTHEKAPFTFAVSVTAGDGLVYAFLPNLCYKIWKHTQFAPNCVFQVSYVASVREWATTPRSNQYLFG